MNLMKMLPGEFRLADVTTPFRALIFPALELILYSGLCWIAIGWLDTNLSNSTYHNAGVILWLILVLTRFAHPVWRARKRRFIVTNTRVIARTGSKVDSIPFAEISGVRRRRGGISLAIQGYQQPLFFPELAKAKKIERIISEQLHPFQWHETRY